MSVALNAGNPTETISTGSTGKGTGQNSPGSYTIQIKSYIIHTFQAACRNITLKIKPGTVLLVVPCFLFLTSLPSQVVDWMVYWLDNQH